MPIMKIHTIKKEDVVAISTSLINELESLLKCPRNYFVLEVVTNTVIMDGAQVQGLPRIEVYWFNRGQVIQDAFAQIVTNKVHQVGYENVDVLFFELHQESFYENGTHF
jgi:hypothetical protein